MGFTDAVSGAIDTAAGALGGGGGGSAPKPDTATPEYHPDDALDPIKDKKPLAVGPNGGDTPPNTAQPPDPTEFVHFGCIHADTTDHFAHPKFDNEKDKKPAGRAILFRDALEREALLLHGFVTATKTIHEELKKNRGVAGEVAGAIGSLVGKSSSEPDPGSLKNLLDDITKAGGTINADTCDYVKIHKAGIDFHQTRADYAQYCTKKLDGYYLNPTDDGKSLLMSLPAVSGAAKTVFGILFKAFDIYFGMYLRLRSTYEPEIEKACHKFSIDVVKGYKTNTFSPWYAAKKDPPPAAAKSSLPGALGGVADTISDTKKDVTDALGEPEAKDPPPGEGAINDIFAILGSGPADKKKEGEGDAPPPKTDPAKEPPKIKPADGLVNEGFAKVLKIDKLPGFLETAIGKMVWANVDFLKAVYLKLCADSTKKIDDQWLNETAHTLIFSKLYGFIEDTVSFIKDIEDAGVNVQGQKLGPGKQIDKAKEALAQKVGGYADPVLKLAIDKLSEKLEQIRSDADKNKSLTMEVFLGQLPFLLAFQVRNTTFPVWDLVIGDLLGKGNLALDTAMKPVRGFIGDARSIVNDVKDKADRIKAAKDKFDKEGVGMGSGGQNVTGYKDILFGDKPKPPGAGAGGGGSFPGGARTTAGTGPKITSDNLDKAKGDRKSPWPVKP